jgi:RNA polymerase sigma factor (sigma-70 family)
MAISPIKTVFRHLREAGFWREAEESADGQLLKRFIEGRDESAFETLVLRHGPMVLSVCRRVLGNAHDAEDAFQAVFLILVRKAGSIGKAELLGNWLYGVAYRTALEAKGKTVRRWSHEKQVKDMPHPVVVPDADNTELLAILDRELNRLPDKYRVPVVLCELEGGSRKEVARQLSLPEGTLSSRLATARKMLAKRLERHGLTVSAGVLLTAFAPNAAATSLSTALVQSTVHAAAGVAAGHAIKVVVSAKIGGLMEGVLKAMFIQKLKVLVAVLIGIALAGGGLLTYRAALSTASAQEGKPRSETPTPVDPDGTLALKDTDAERAAKEAQEAAAKEAAIKAARAKETPTVPEQAKAADIKVDFLDVSISIRPAPGRALSQPESIRIRGDGICEYRIEERPGRGNEPKWDAACLIHKLELKRLRRLEELLKKTDWLTAAGHEGRADQMHATKYSLTLKRQGKRRTITLDGEKGDPYKSLVSFFHGIALQENLLYRLERLPGKVRFETCSQIDQYVRAERGERYDKPLFEIDLRRYVPTFQRYVRYPFTHFKEEIVPAVRLLGHFRSESDREYIAALANDRDGHILEAVAEALGALGGKESVPVLRRMIRSGREAAWQLIRLGPLAVPTIVEVIESGDPTDERDPRFIDYEHLIRSYLDHWDQVPKPIDPRVLAAVRKSMADPKVKTLRTVYHKELLELASRPPLPPPGPAPSTK